MSRGMWIIGAVIAVLAISMIYQSEFGGGLDRPWMQCKESLVKQMLPNVCTPRAGKSTVPDSTTLD